MGNRNSRLTKRVINDILSVYSVRKNEFYRVDGDDEAYMNQYIKGYMITIRKELDDLKDRYTGRIIVTHSDDKGVIQYTDIWEQKGDELCFCYRNLKNTPVQDKEYVKEIEQSNRAMMLAGKKLQKEIGELQNEIRELKEKIQDGSSTSKAKGKPGRKPDPDRMHKQVLQLAELTEQGKKEEQICKEMGISRATYFRYKKKLKTR